ncbi:src kinase-associated phosphoprotein 2-like, partial [Acipenser oxyrinchus oxyrinchus]
YQGLWDCAGDQPEQLSFQRGDLIYILSKVGMGPGAADLFHWGDSECIRVRHSPYISVLYSEGEW